MKQSECNFDLRIASMCYLHSVFSFEEHDVISPVLLHELFSPLSLLVNVYKEVVIIRGQQSNDLLQLLRISMSINKKCVI